MAPAWKAIIIHHSDTEDDANAVDWIGIRKFHMSWRLNGETMTPEQIARYKAALKELNGKTPPPGWLWAQVQAPWRDIGYHWGIEQVHGKIVFQKGRGLDQPGAHCEGMNSQAIGICCVGDFDKYRPSDAVYFNCAQLCGMMIRQFPAITPWDIYPHRKFSTKTCPGSQFDMERLVKYVKYYLGTGGQQ